MLEEVKILEQYNGCIAYNCGAIYYIRLNKETIASNHVHDD